ncbi:MAG: hypothetical protein COW01_10550 [Bdellovibrionales bacterium CG12_big_fil_rev_8_21_14_0_65_38_15]|nr:MAG: hypothetical protein COW79_07395 [Bdellovibrionales bacterium CG22_combo_CG10-13_8_21_14_all_38_13]PIQ54576.1 MAG: hypothetical protein COW01_10550 [Bdellovibrionales bacterium CG12_big_fil_rev_8_21_14_0_65_38_15]PIR29957.1 MAG: hypothetical protein COV38_08395 [Bdellovibrionales bacterium CG11_big_fil_rev_8_21_14_0_20_38_13]
MKNYKLILLVTINLLATTIFAQSFDLNTAPRYNDFYECELEGGDVMNIHLHHMRITEATVNVFGQTFTGYGAFYDKIIVSDKSATYDEAKTLHIFTQNSSGLPILLHVHTALTRAPFSYKLDCKKL